MPPLPRVLITMNRPIFDAASMARFAFIWRLSDAVAANGASSPGPAVQAWPARRRREIPTMVSASAGTTVSASGSNLSSRGTAIHLTPPPVAAFWSMMWVLASLRGGDAESASLLTPCYVHDRHGNRPSRARAHRTVADRRPARRHRVHRAVQLRLREAARRQVRPPHRGHRPEPRPRATPSR